MSGSKREDRDLSKVIFSTLENLGYNKENIIFRSKCNAKKNECFNSMFKRTGISEVQTFTLIFAGSQSEGLHLADSDVDVMFVTDGIVCLDHCNSSGQFIILQADYSSTAPGYTKVIYEQEAFPLSDPSQLTALLCCSRERNFPYISSTKFKHAYFELCHAAKNIQDFKFELSYSGPAVTTCHKRSTWASEFDNVLSVYFFGGKYLPRWENRRRHWPSKEIVNEIADMEGYIVPVGDKQSENQDLEWRICYTTAEQKLVSNLNNIQLKLYVLLKLLSKHVLKPVCKALTSYVMKNVVFWVSETIPAQDFLPGHLIHLVLKSLHFIKLCIENNHLPSYMIPERNLLRGAVSGSDKHTVTSFLSECLTNGRHTILMIPKLNQCVSLTVKSPENMARFGIWRDKTERLVSEIITVTGFKPESLYIWDTSKESIRELTFKERIEMELNLLFFVVPDIFTMLRQGKVDEAWKLYNKRIELLNFL